MSIKRKSLVWQLDKAFSDYIRERDGHRCVVCGSVRNLQCGHLFSRVAYSTRWSVKNAACQCSACNMRHEYDPFPLTNWFLCLYGDEGYRDLHRIHRTTVKFSDAMLAQMIEYYRNERASLLLSRN